VTWARGEPTNTARSPSLAHRPLSPPAMPRYRWPMWRTPAPRQRLIGLHRLPRRHHRHKPLGVLAFHALGPLQVEKVPQGLLPERQQVQLDPEGKYPERCGKLGRPNTGAAPIAVIRFDTSARWSISSTAMPRTVLRHRVTASACSAVTHRRPV